MKHSKKLIGKAVIANVFEFDIIDAVDARDAYYELSKAMQDSVEVDDEGVARQNPIVIDECLANSILMLLSKIAAPAMDTAHHNGHCGIFEPMNHEPIATEEPIKGE